MTNVLERLSTALGRSYRLDRELGRPFDLARSCGLRVLLARTAEDGYLLHLCFHNTLFDFPSLMVILHDLRHERSLQ